MSNIPGMNDEFKEIIKEKLLEALGLSQTEGIPINKLIFAYTMFKRLELNEQNTEGLDRIIVEYIDNSAKGDNTSRGNIDDKEDTVT